MAGVKQTGKVASVDTEAVELVGKSPEVLIAENENRPVKTEETISGEDGDVQVTHTRPGTLVMYKPTETQGYVVRTVSGSAVGQLLLQGWKEFCPDCKGKHLDKNGVASTDPNLCKAREPVAVRVCQVCDKRIYDNLRFRNLDDVEEDDPNVIKEEFGATTGADRTRVTLNIHYWVRHALWAQMMGLDPLPAAVAAEMLPKEGAKA